MRNKPVDTVHGAPDESRLKQLLVNVDGFEQKAVAVRAYLPHRFNVFDRVKKKRGHLFPTDKPISIRFLS